MILCAGVTILLDHVINHIFEVLGLSLFECYDMTEKLYKEVKKIATEINNFLNEGEFR